MNSCKHLWTSTLEEVLVTFLEKLLRQSLRNNQSNLWIQSSGNFWRTTLKNIRWKISWGTSSWDEIIDYWLIRGRVHKGFPRIILCREFWSDSIKKTMKNPYENGRNNWSNYCPVSLGKPKRILFKTLEWPLKFFFSKTPVGVCVC